MRGLFGKGSILDIHVRLRSGWTWFVFFFFIVWGWVFNSSKMPLEFFTILAIFIVTRLLLDCSIIKKDYCENYKDGEVRLKFDLIQKSFVLNSDRWVFKRMDYVNVDHRMRTAIGYIKSKQAKGPSLCYFPDRFEVIDVSLSFIDYLRYLNFKYDLRCENLRKEAERQRKIENEKTIEIIKDIQSDINRAYDQISRLGEKIKEKEQV